MAGCRTGPSVPGLRRWSCPASAPTTLAIDHPQLVRRLVLFASACRLPPYWPRAVARRDVGSGAWEACRLASGRVSKVPGPAVLVE